MRGMGVGLGRRKKVTVRATDPLPLPLVPGQALGQGWSSFVLRVWVVRGCCICAPRFFDVSRGGFWAVQEPARSAGWLAVCLAEDRAGQGRTGPDRALARPGRAGRQAGNKQYAFLVRGATCCCGFCCAALCCAVPRGRDPGLRWHGVAWPMEVEVGIFFLCGHGHGWIPMEGGGPDLVREHRRGGRASPCQERRGR